MDTLLGILHMIIFPGGIFALVLGFFFKGLDRRVVARLQRRVGPPLAQPWYDTAKFLTKETLIPKTACRTAFLHREESLEGEAVAWQSRVDKRRDKCCGARQRLNGDVVAPALPGKHEPWVANAGRASIGYQGYVVTLFKQFYNGLCGLVLIKLVMTSHGGGDAIVLHEHSAGASVFGKDERHLLQHLHCPGCHVVEIAHGGRDHI